MTEIIGTKSDIVQMAGLKNDTLTALDNLLEGELDLNSLRASDVDIDSLESLFELSAHLKPASAETKSGECTRLFDNAFDTTIDRAHDELTDLSSQTDFQCSIPHSEDAVLQLDNHKKAKSFRKPTIIEVPDWCSRLSFAELDDLKIELNELKVLIDNAQEEIDKVTNRILDLNEIKVALLSFSDLRLRQSCCKVFAELGWSVILSETSPEEILLADGGKIQAIVRIAYSTGPASRVELTKLAESIITHWIKYDTEPKGIFLASTFAEQAPTERTKENFPGQFSDFAGRKSLCLLTCMQLLSIYRDVTIRNACSSKIREELLSTTGVLSAHDLDLTE